MVHFSVHSAIDREFPDRSGLVLTSGSTGQEDDLLQAHEIIDLKMRAACHAFGLPWRRTDAEVLRESLAELPHAVVVEKFLLCTLLDRPDEFAALGREEKHLNV